MTRVVSFTVFPIFYILKHFEIVHECGFQLLLENEIGNTELQFSSAFSESPGRQSLVTLVLPDKVTRELLKFYVTKF